MAKSFSELQTLAIQIRDELNKKKNSAQRVGSALLDIIDNCIQNITDIKQKLSVFEHACSGFKRVSSEAQLPVTPSQEDLAKGFLVNTSLYLYVGTGGNAVNGRYFNVGDIRGPQGEPGSKGETGNTGPTGEKGEQGNSGVTGDTSDIVVINNLDGGESEEGSIKVLAAEQGKVLNKKLTLLENKMGYNGVISVNDSFEYAIRGIRKIIAFTDVDDDVEVYVIKYDNSGNLFFINVREVSTKTQIGYFPVRFEQRPTGIVTLICDVNKNYSKCALYAVIDFSKQENAQSEDCHIKIEKAPLDSSFYFSLFKSKEFAETQNTLNADFDNRVTTNTSAIAGISEAIQLKTEYIDATISEKKTGYYITYEGNLSQTGSSQTNLFKVKSGEEYKITGSLKLNGLCYAVYNDLETINSDTCIYKGKSSTVSSTIEVNDVLIIPDGGLILAVWFSFSVQKKKYTANDIDTNIIDGWGDSLTAGSGGEGTTYLTELQKLLGDTYTVNNYGHGGETAAAIAFRQGGLKILLDPFTIANGGQGTCTFKAINGMSLKTLFSNANGTQGTNNIFIGDKKVMFRTTANANECTLYNNRGVGDLSYDRPVMARAEGGGTQHILIICMGQNGTYEGSYDINLLVELYKLMITYNNYSKYIVAGIPTSDKEQWGKLEMLLGTAFGDHFFNSREYISQYGLLDNKLSPTEDDTTAMGKGAIPPSLLSNYPTDRTHMNGKGYSSWAKGLYEKGKQLGYW